MYICIFFSVYLDVFIQDEFNLYGWIACILKTTLRKQMSFYSFLQTGGHSITFSINSMDVHYFIFGSLEYLNWLTTDILQLLSVMQILTEWNVARGIISWGFTPALSISVETSWAQVGFRPLRAMWLFEWWHPIRTIFRCEYGWVATGHRSIPSCVNTVCSETSSWLLFFSPVWSNRKTHTLHTHSCMRLSHMQQLFTTLL